MSKMMYVHTYMKIYIYRIPSSLNNKNTSLGGRKNNIRKGQQGHSIIYIYTYIYIYTGYIPACVLNPLRKLFGRLFNAALHRVLHYN